MANGVYTSDTIASLIQETFSGSLAHTLNDRSPAYASLQAKGRVQTDKRIALRWPAIKKAYDGVTNIKDGQTLPDAAQQEYMEATLNYKIFIGVLRFGRLLQMGQNPDEFFRTPEGATLLDSQTKAAILQMERDIHSQIVGADSETDGIICLGDAVGKNNNTYASLARGTYAYWQPYVNGNGGTNRSITETLLRDMYDTLTDVRGSNIDECWCGTTAYNALKDLFLTNKVSYPQSETVRGGTTQIFWNGIPFLRMPNMDTNSIYWLDFESDEGITLKRQHDQDFIVKEESTNSYDTRYSIAGHYQLVVHNPWRQGALNDVQ